MFGKRGAPGSAVSTDSSAPAAVSEAPARASEAPASQPAPVPAPVAPESEGGSPLVGLGSGPEGGWAHDPSRTAASDRAIPRCLEERVMFMVLAHPSEERVGV